MVSSNQEPSWWGGDRVLPSWKTSLACFSLGQANERENSVVIGEVPALSRGGEEPHAPFGRRRSAHVNAIDLGGEDRARNHAETKPAHGGTDATARSLKRHAARQQLVSLSADFFVEVSREDERVIVSSLGTVCLEETSDERLLLDAGARVHVEMDVHDVDQPSWRRERHGHDALQRLVRSRERVTVELALRA